jgi:hypothetical protein
LLTSRISSFPATNAILESWDTDSWQSKSWFRASKKSATVRRLNPSPGAVLSSEAVTTRLPSGLNWAAVPDVRIACVGKGREHFPAIRTLARLSNTRNVCESLLALVVSGKSNLEFDSKMLGVKESPLSNMDSPVTQASIANSP